MCGKSDRGPSARGDQADRQARLARLCRGRGFAPRARRPRHPRARRHGRRRGGGSSPYTDVKLPSFQPAATAVLKPAPARGVTSRTARQGVHFRRVRPGEDGCADPVAAGGSGPAFERAFAISSSSASLNRTLTMYGGCPRPSGRRSWRRTCRRGAPPRRDRRSRPLGVVHQPDPVLPLPPLHDVVVGAHPADPIPLRRALVGRVPERDEEPAVGAILADVPVAGQRARQFPRRRPGLALVVGEDHERVVLAAVLPQQDGDLLAVGGADQARLAEVGVGCSAMTSGWPQVRPPSCEIVL